MSRILSEYNQESTRVTKDNLAEHSRTILRLIEKNDNFERYRPVLQSYYQENGLSPKDAKERVDTDLYALQDTKGTIPLLRELAERADVGVFISTGNIDSTKEFKLYSLIQHPKIYHVASLQRSIEPRDAFPQIAYQTALNTAATFLASAVSGRITPFTLSQPIKTNGAVNSNTTTLTDSYFRPTTEPRVFTAHQGQLLDRALATSQTNNALFATPADIAVFKQNNFIFSALSVTPNAPEAEKLYPLKDVMNIRALSPQMRADLAAITQQPHKTYVLYDNKSDRFLRSGNVPILFSQADDGSLRATTLPTWGGTSLAAPTAMAREAIVRKFIPTDLHTALHYAAATNSTLDIRRPLIEQPVGNLATYLHALKNGQQQR
ncbi:MAG: hypothetical protein INF44_01615 [Thalassospira sp.]|nr:hypothetical protein [Thalassospira sp.]